MTRRVCWLQPSETALTVRWAFTGDEAEPLIENARVAWSSDGRATFEPLPRGVSLDEPTSFVHPATWNAHTHLELSNIRRPPYDATRPQAFTQWLRGVIADRSNRRAAVQRGLSESAAAGVEGVCDIVTSPDAIELPDSEVDRVRCFEVLGLSSDAGHERLQRTIARLTAVGDGISPHAPYSVARDLLAACVTAAGTRPLAMHIAEHPAEDDLLRTGTGVFRTFLEDLGVYEQSRLASSVDEVLAMMCEAERPIVVHGNHLSRPQLKQLARHDNATLVWCPRTHAYFGFRPHPVAEALSVGLRVAIGTDSRASSPTLDPWDDVGWVVRHRPDVAIKEAVAMATSAPRVMLGIKTEPRFVLRPLCDPDATEAAAAIFGQRASR